MIKRKKLNFSIIFATLIIFLISLIFYGNLWRQIFVKENINQLTIQGESPIYEFVAETVKNNTLSFKNPFAKINSVLYPFGWRFAMDDMAPIYGIYFLIVRSFLSIHQSFIFIMLSGVIFSGLTMYCLLILLNVKKIPALISALVFCFSPFVTVRIGAHPTYTAFYLFVLPVIIFLKLSKEKKEQIKYFWAFLLGTSLTMIVLTNLYFAVMSVLLILTYTIISHFIYREKVISVILINIKFLFTSLVTSLFLLLPWISELQKIILSGTLDKPSDWNDIISYSADLTNLFIPTYLNPFYRHIMEKLSTNNLYISKIFENFIFPGFLIIISMVIYLFIKKKLPKFLKPIYLTSLIFLIFTFGPYLQIFGKLYKIPLPYIVIPYLPYIQMARSPGRFIVPFIFLSALILGFIIQYILEKMKPKIYRYILIITLFFIFFIDQFASISPPAKILIPVNIYKYLSIRPVGPILELPFSIRDSIKNFGYMNVIWAPYTQLLHHQKIFSVYAGRVPNVMFNYYPRNPLLGSLGKIIDADTINYKNITDKINLDNFKIALDFYKISHVVLKNDEKYSTTVTHLIKNIGFSKIMVDGSYSLWYRKPVLTNITEVSFDSDIDELVLADGWGNRELNVKTRWMITKISSILISLEKVNKKYLVIEGEPIVKNQIVKVFINDKYIGKMNFPIGKFTRQELITSNLKPGLNKISFESRDVHILSKIIPGSKDKRPLSLHVRYIGIK